VFDGRSFPGAVRLFGKTKTETSEPHIPAYAARVLEFNPTLINLSLLQSLTSARNASNTMVVDLSSGFVPCKKERRSCATTREGRITGPKTTLADGRDRSA